MEIWINIYCTYIANIYTVSLFLKIPLSFIGDIFVHDYKLGLYSTCGGILVIIGFLILESVWVNVKKYCNILGLKNKWKLLEKELQSKLIV